MAAAATPITNWAARAVIKRINQYGHGLASRYRSLSSASARSAARDSAAGAASSIRTPLRFFPTPLPTGFFTFFLSGCAFFGALRASSPTFFPALGAGFFSTFVGSLQFSLYYCVL